MKREGSLSFLMIFTFIVPELEALYFIQCHRKILVRRVPFIFGRNNR